MSERTPRLLAVGAHPDDVEFGCGGVLLAEAARGSKIFLCVCSRGESATNGTPEEREAEAKCAAQLLGAELQFLDLGGDSHIESSVRNALAIARCIRLVKPDTLLGPVTSPDQHPDHAAIGRLCRDAARLARYGGIAELREIAPHTIERFYGYAVTPGAEPPPDHPAIRVDISAQFARWIDLMECHQTQLRTRRYIELQTARARLLGLEAGVEYAQALFPSSSLLVKTLAEIPPSIRLF
jgi:LmbE family N-acetylglucosaminyl deacetylase